MDEKVRSNSRCLREIRRKDEGGLAAFYVEDEGALDVNGVAVEAAGCPTFGILQEFYDLRVEGGVNAFHYLDTVDGAVATNNVVDDDFASGTVFDIFCGDAEIALDVGCEGAFATGILRSIGDLMLKENLVLGSGGMGRGSRGSDSCNEDKAEEKE